jgi:RHS repeat-associated protein
VLHQLGTTTLDGASYTGACPERSRGDLAGNRKTRTDKRLGTTLTYAYDSIYQLLTAKQGTTTKESYTYDLVGNRLSSVGVTPYQYNTSNQLTSIPGTTYTYDNNGNTKTKTTAAGTTTYTWDYDNRLKQVTLPGTGGTVTYKYDPFGRRVQKSFTQSGTTTTTNYLYDGHNLLEEVDNSGNVLGRYTQDEGIDDPLSILRSGTASYYQADALGTVTSLSNSAGALANTYAYDSFGNLTASTGTITNPVRYTGREFDSETGLSYYRARYYDPQNGRFLSEDLIRSLFDLNRYKYVGNHPLVLTDPLGLLAQNCRYTGREWQDTPWLPTTWANSVPITGWTLTWSGETGGPDESGIPFAILNCRWTRLVSKTVGQIAEFSRHVECTDVLPCGVTVKWWTLEAEWRRRQKTYQDIETTTTHHIVWGMDSDTLDDLYCLKWYQP